VEEVADVGDRVADHERHERNRCNRNRPGRIPCDEARERGDEDRWIIEHRRALALLGLDLNTNCAPAHFKCGEVKTHTQDLPRIRKAKRQQMAGAKNEKAGSRFSNPGRLLVRSEAEALRRYSSVGPRPSKLRTKAFFFKME
jgi:hypothetical protein